MCQLRLFGTIVPSVVALSLNDFSMEVEMISTSYSLSTLVKKCCQNVRCCSTFRRLNILETNLGTVELCSSAESHFWSSMFDLISFGYSSTSAISSCCPEGQASFVVVCSCFANTNSCVFSSVCKLRATQKVTFAVVAAEKFGALRGICLKPPLLSHSFELNPHWPLNKASCPDYHLPEHSVSNLFPSHSDCWTLWKAIFCGPIQQASVLADLCGASGTTVDQTLIGWISWLM